VHRLLMRNAGTLRRLRLYARPSVPILVRTIENYLCLECIDINATLISYAMIHPYRTKRVICPIRYDWHEIHRLRALRILRLDHIHNSHLSMICKNLEMVEKLVLSGTPLNYKKVVERDLTRYKKLIHSYFYDGYNIVSEEYDGSIAEDIHIHSHRLQDLELFGFTIKGLSCSNVRTLTLKDVCLKMSIILPNVNCLIIENFYMDPDSFNILLLNGPRVRHLNATSVILRDLWFPCLISVSIFFSIIGKNLVSCLHRHPHMRNFFVYQSEYE
jgi:hypothetical protein